MFKVEGYDVFAIKLTIIVYPYYVAYLHFYISVVKIVRDAKIYVDIQQAKLHAMQNALRQFTIFDSFRYRTSVN